jgi:ribonuclease Z
MLRTTMSRLAILAATLLIAALAYVQGYSDRDQGRLAGLVSTALAAGGSEIKPTQKLPDPNVYFPGSEQLAADEMRLISCGTGMPTARESQAASCWLLELGNGDKFIFDGGTGSAARIASLHIPYEFLNKIFISHLHTDHFGDFSAYFVGGWLAGRQGPLHIYGPSGDRPETGTKYAIEHWEKALTWDVEGRAGRLPASGGKERDRLPGKRRDDPLVAGQPRDRRARQLQPGVERSQVRVRGRHLPEPVVREVRQGR